MQVIHLKYIYIIIELENAFPEENVVSAVVQSVVEKCFSKAT